MIHGALKQLGVGLLAGMILAAPTWALTEEDIAADRSLWPSEIKITRKTPVKLYAAGKEIGGRLLKPGETYPIRKIRANEISLNIDGAFARVPPANTDLVRRVEGGDSSGNFKPRAGAASGELSPLGKKLSGKLVEISGNGLKRMPAKDLAGVKYFAIYYSAHWCGPCRAFTPKLVSFYKQFKPKHPDFEVIFVSSDRSPTAMTEYMRGDHMPWPALAYDQKGSASFVTKYAGRGIPCLVFVDGNGKVLADSYVGGRYVGPGSVVAAITKKLGSSSTASR